MLSPFASLRVNCAKHLALLFFGGKVQSEILRFAQNDSEGFRMTRQWPFSESRWVLIEEGDERAN
jgi:hypothetical protein